MDSSNKGSEKLTKSAGTSVATGAEKPKLYVTDSELTENDVLMGRGAPIINYAGNVSFRELVQTRKVEYVSAIRHQLKGNIAKQIAKEITEGRGGRFLQRIESAAEAGKLGLPDGTKGWKHAKKEVVLEKVKQALRDKHPGKAAAGKPISSGHISSDDVPSAHPNATASSSGTESSLRSLRNAEFTQRFSPHRDHAFGSNPSVVAAQLFLQQQEQNRQQIAMLDEDRLRQQYMLLLGQQQQQNQQYQQHQQNVLSPGLANLTPRDVLEIRRREGGMASFTPQFAASGASQVSSLHDRGFDPSQVARASLRDQQQQQQQQYLDLMTRQAQQGIMMQGAAQGSMMQGSAQGNMSQHRDHQPFLGGHPHIDPAILTLMHNRSLANQHLNADAAGPSESSFANQHLTAYTAGPAMSLTSAVAAIGPGPHAVNVMGDESKASSPAGSKEGSMGQKPRARGAEGESE